MLLLSLLACPAPDSADKDTADTADTAETGDTTDTTDTTDTGTSPALWEECPTADAWVGDTSWTGSVVVTGAALYCSGSNEDRELPDELRTKMQLRLIEGTYAAPTADGSYTLALAACTHTAEDGAAPQMDGEGSTEVSFVAAGGMGYTTVEGSQPLLTPDGASWTLAHILRFVGPESGPPDPLTLDGAEADPTTGAAAELTVYAAGGSPYDADARVFVPCNDPGWVLNTHALTFDGGDITLEMYVGDDPVGTAPTAFVRASGTLDGVTFEQSDFFALAYRPGHHNMSRDFAVVLPTAIGAACALRIEDVDDQEASVTGQVSLADCDLNAVESRTVTADTLTLGGA